MPSLGDSWVVPRLQHVSSLTTLSASEAFVISSALGRLKIGREAPSVQGVTGVVSLELWVQ